MKLTWLVRSCAAWPAILRKPAGMPSSKGLAASARPAASPACAAAPDREDGLCSSLQTQVKHIQVHLIVHQLSKRMLPRLHAVDA